MATIQGALNDLPDVEQIRSRSCPRCYMCGAEGDSLYHDLKDRYFAAQGVWNIRKCRNAGCGHAWLDPMPIEEDIGRAYESYFTHADNSGTTTQPAFATRFVQALRTRYLDFAYGYTRNGAGVFGKLPGLLVYLAPFRRAQLDFDVMYLPCVPAGRLLEVGCGSGAMLKGMANLGWHVEGIDFDPAAVQNCRRKELEVHLGTLEEFRYPENHFDAITMSHLIEHVYDPLALLQECSRILKAGGRLSLVTPNLKSMGHRLYRSSWFHLDPPRHLHLFTADSLSGLLQKAGFLKTKMRTTIRYANTAFVAGRSIKRTGRYQFGASHPRIASIWGRMMQTIEWGLLKAGFEVGEELAVIAENGKPV
jgi:2-polyprenyl-3-methyl-5-hydroxy-6-metoxy-1,4-benzoquinol methylase